jgi:hypothetical protein
MPTLMGLAAGWLGLVSLVVISALGLQSATSALDSAETLGQQAGIAARIPRSW